MKIYYSLGEVARLLDVRPHRIVYLHTVAKAASQSESLETEHTPGATL